MGAPATPEVIGRYTIHGKIASGGMARVHYGRLIGAAGFSRTVAIKRLHAHLAEDPEFLSTMIDEARLAARIHHPNVVPTLDVVAENGELLVIMEYVRGESLARLLKAEAARGRSVPTAIASAIVIGALHGLHAAHEATTDQGEPLGIVHRDVSPQNILVGADGTARVIDFGVAKAAGRLQTTREGVVKGKMAYMGPEILQAQIVTRAADIYAMGVVLWETLTGKRLFQGESDAELVLKVLAGAKDPPSRHAPGVPAGLDALVMKALAVDPGDRFASAQDMAEVLLRAAPPAFPTVVAKWVQEAAGDALAKRAKELAEIESRGDMTALPRPSTTPVVPATSSTRAVAEAEDGPVTVASQPSSLSVETPKSAFPGVMRSRRAKVLGVIGGGVVLVGLVLFLSLRGSTPDPTASGAPATSGAGSVEAPTVASGIPEPPAAMTATSATSPPLPVVLPTTVPPTPPPPEKRALAPHPPPPTATSKPRPAPRPAASFRFAQPD
jgi:serine/threonine protein kinase